MKTQINNLVNGSQFVAGTNNETRAAIAAQVLAENGDTLRILVGGQELELMKKESTTGNTWWYKCNITDEQALAIFNINMNMYKYEHHATLTISMDMRVYVSIFAHKTAGSQWKHRGDYYIANNLVTIL